MAPTQDQPIHVLHVDDDPTFSALVAQSLEREDDRLAVYTVTTPEEGRSVIQQRAIECVVSDYDMPGRDGLEFLSAVRAEYPELPFVRYTGPGGEAVASPIRSEGGTVALQESGSGAQYRILADRITNAVERRRADADRRRHLDETETALEGVGPRDDDHPRFVDTRPWVVYRCRNELGRPMEEISGDVRELTGHSATALWAGEVSFGTEVTHSADRSAVWGALKDAVDTDGSFDLTYRIDSADGDTRFVWEHGQVSPPTGGVTTFEGFITDVTDLVG
jgi:CheY-like chemotaxis protein